MCVAIELSRKRVISLDYFSSLAYDYYTDPFIKKFNILQEAHYQLITTQLQIKLIWGGGGPVTRPSKIEKIIFAWIFFTKIFWTSAFYSVYVPNLKSWIHYWTTYAHTVNVIFRSMNCPGMPLA